MQCAYISLQISRKSRNGPLEIFITILFRSKTASRKTQISWNSLWASSFSWNARNGADSQVLGVTLGVKLIFVFSVTFGTKGLWGWFVARELFVQFKKLLFSWNINFLSFLRRKVGFNFYSVTYLVRVANAIYQEKIPPELVMGKKGGNHLPTVAVRWHHMFSVTSHVVLIDGISMAC